MIHIRYDFLVHDCTVYSAAASKLIDVNGSIDARLGIQYRGDAARVYYGKRLLTDNFFSGYVGHGQLDVGLSYLAGVGEAKGVLTVRIYTIQSYNTVYRKLLHAWERKEFLSSHTIFWLHVFFWGYCRLVQISPSRYCR